MASEKLTGKFWGNSSSDDSLSDDSSSDEVNVMTEDEKLDQLLNKINFRRGRFDFKMQKAKFKKFALIDIREFQHQASKELIQKYHKKVGLYLSDKDHNLYTTVIEKNSHIIDILLELFTNMLNEEGYFEDIKKNLQIKIRILYVNKPSIEQELLKYAKQNDDRRRNPAKLAMLMRKVKNKKKFGKPKKTTKPGPSPIGLGFEEAKRISGQQKRAIISTPNPHSAKRLEMANKHRFKSMTPQQKRYFTGGKKRKRTRKKTRKCSKKRIRKRMICYRGTKKKLKKLKRITKKLKLRLTKCSKRRMNSWTKKKRR